MRLRSRRKGGVPLAAIASALVGLALLGPLTVPSTTASAQDVRMKAWGNNRTGQLGDGTNVDLRRTPTSVVGLDSAEVDKIAAGGESFDTGFGLALTKQGIIESWGANTEGQLGDGPLNSHNVPGEVAGLTDVKAIAAGGAHALAIVGEDREVRAWGRNDFGQLGDGSTNDSNAPVRVHGIKNILAIAAGLNHSLALQRGGIVWAWGYNGDGQLGNGSNIDSSQPVQVGDLSNVKAIAAGCNHSLAITDDPNDSKYTDIVRAWGNNSSGQLGNGTTTSSNKPVDTTRNLLGTGITQIAAGCNHSLALGSQNLMAWGQNTSGQIGDGTNDNRLIPCELMDVTAPLSFAGGRAHTLIVANDQTVRSWGYNGSGQLGNGKTESTNTPGLAFTARSSVKRVAAPVGADFSYAY